MNNGHTEFFAAAVIPVIKTTLTRKGDGESTPVRIITQYWSPDGKLLAELDPVPDHEREIKILQDAILWALGEKGEFPSRPVGLGAKSGAYWWRNELRRRACGLLPKTEGVSR